MMLKGVLFDLDGTLIDTESQYTVLWGMIGEKYHPDISDFAWLIKGKTLNIILSDYFQNDKTKKEVITYLDEFEASMRYEFVPHVLPFLLDIRKHGVKTAVVTSSNDKKMQKVRSHIPGFDSYFDKVLVAEDFSKSKPDPDCYIRAVECLGLSFEECVIFEDAVNGLEAGSRSSIMTIGVVGTLRAEEIRPFCDSVIDSFEGKNYEWLCGMLKERKYLSISEKRVLKYLDAHQIHYSLYHHPEGRTIEEAKRWWHRDGSMHCKNIFLRNHKGNQHYLFSFHCDRTLSIHNIEACLKAELISRGDPAPGKLSFASVDRMKKYLGVTPGSVSPLGLINDETHHVIFFMDEELKSVPLYSFHPNDCRATVVLSKGDFDKFLISTGNECRYMSFVE